VAGATALLAAAAAHPEAASALTIHPEPSNALSLPTWAIHVSSVTEWVAAMALFWKYAEVRVFAGVQDISTLQQSHGCRQLQRTAWCGCETNIVSLAGCCCFHAALHNWFSVSAVKPLLS
jgi:hypothetical protein